MKKEAKKGRKPNTGVVFENEEYQITEIPLNYAIDVKIMVDGNKRHERVKLLPEQFYSPLEWGLNEAHAIAKHMISKYSQNIEP